MRRPLEEVVDLHHVLLHDPVEPRLRLTVLGRELAGAERLPRGGRHHRARDHPGDRLHLLAEAQLAPPAPPAPTILYRRSRGLTKDPDRERIERLKDAVAIEDVIGQHLALRPSGQVLLGRCPFHEDRTPSFAVYSEARRFYCFGCGKRGDVITFVRELEGLGFPEALDALERLTGNYGAQTQPNNPTAEGAGDPDGVSAS
jgi:hypothetical protein